MSAMPSDKKQIGTGVIDATIRTVVFSSLAVLAVDFELTAMMVSTS